MAQPIYFCESYTSTHIPEISNYKNDKDLCNKSANINSADECHVYKNEVRQTVFLRVEDFEIDAQVKSIHYSLAKITDPGEQRRAKDFLDKALAIREHALKMSELGVLLFYLDQPSPLPKAFSLFTFWIENYQQEIKKCIRHHAALGSPSNVPSGKIHCLLLAFAQLCLTSDQSYNKGGLFAVKELLKHPQYKIAKYLKPEHTEHILSVIQQLINHPGIQKLFEKKWVVHPTMQEVVRHELKIGYDEAVTSTNMLTACLIFLFSDTRQFTSPNCYAISALIYITEFHTYKTLMSLINWLVTGHIIMPNGVHIPITPILEERLRSQWDMMQTDLPLSPMLNLIPIKQLFRQLKIPPKTSRDFNLCTLESTLAYLIPEEDQRYLLPFAKKTLRAYVRSPLMELHLALMEFVDLNWSPTDPTISSHIALKDTFIKQCMTGLHSLIHSTRLSPLFVQFLQKKLHERLWFYNDMPENPFKYLSVLSLQDAYQSLSFADFSSLNEALHFPIRVFYFDKYCCTPLYQITDLQEAMTKIVEETCATMCDQEPSVKVDALFFSCAVGLPAFRSQLSLFASTQMKGFPSFYLNQNNLLLFKQKGSCSRTPLFMLYDIKLESSFIENAQDIYHLLLKLHDFFKFIDLSYIERPLKVLISTHEHAWTFSPLYWKVYLESKQPFNDWLQSNVFMPGKSKLASFIPENVVHRIIERFTPEIALQMRIKKEFSATRGGKPKTYNYFREWFLGGIHPYTKKAAESLIEEEFSKIILMKADLKKILIFLDVSLDLKKFTWLLKKFSLNKPTTPQRFAYKFCCALSCNGLAIIDPWRVEQAVCKIKQLPLPLPFGDLNYSNLEEGAYHEKLFIEFSWVSAEPSYFTRTQHSKYKENPLPYRNLYVQYPSYMSPNPNSLPPLLSCV